MSSLLDATDIGDVCEGERVATLVKQFQERFGAEPDFLVRAPGRVNLIGEHVDYCGFPVLPISIKQDVMIAGRKDEENRDITITNSDGKFEEFSSPIMDIAIDEVKWYSYVLAGYMGVAQMVNTLAPGLQLMVNGTVPMSAGLSSSSALVCASALLAALFLNLRSLTRESIAELCARSERYVGTQGGGMDQAISFLGVSGKAQLINFNPVRCSPVTLPDSATFVVANCMVNKWKADGTDFNNRVAECKLGARVLAVKLGVPWRDGHIKTYHNLMTEKEMEPQSLLAAVEKHVHQEPYTKQEILDILECSEDEFAEIVGKSDNTVFRLYDRAVHVSGEATRVARFKELCDQETPDVEELGRLINESHMSLKDKYNVSIDELDKLTQICRGSGALGSRLVGAGFGGCTISMVPKKTVDSFITTVWQEYYKPRNVSMSEATQKHLFVTSPCQGACVLRLPS